MANFNITGPDGKKYKVGGETAEGAFAALQKHLGAAPAPDAIPSADPAVAPEDTPGFAKDALAEAMTFPSPPDAKTAVPAVPSVSASGVNLGMPSDPAVPRMQQPGGLAAPLLDANGRPSIDRATPPRPAPPPRADDPMPSAGMMGGGTDQQQQWAIREIARQEAEQAAESLAAALAPPAAAAPPGFNGGFKARALGYRGASAPEESAAQFEGEGAGALLKRRGQQFAKGATEVAASVPEAFAIMGAGADRMQVEGAQDFMDQRSAMIADIQLSLTDESIKPETRIILEKNLADLLVGQGKLTELAAKPVVPAQERPLFAKGDSIREGSAEIFGAPDERDQGFWAGVAQGAGNMAGFAASALVPGGAAAKVATGAALGADLNTSAMYKEALDAGADEETAMKAARIGAVIGASEIIPINRALKLLPKGWGPKVGNRVMRTFVDIAEGAGEEAAQEYLAQVANNITAQQLYDPTRGWTEGATEAALMGAVLGGGTGAIGAAIGEPKPKIATAPKPGNPPSDDPLADAMAPPKAPQNIPDNIPAVAAGDPLTAAMAPDAPPSVQKRTDQNTIKKPDAEPSTDGFEIMDEVETVDGETRPTGRRVRINTATGDAEVVDEDSDAVKSDGIGGVGPTGDNPQAEREAEVVSTPSPPAVPEPKPTENVGATKGPTRKFLSHAETLAIETDPKTFQYKGGADTEGVTEALRGVKAFDPNRAGQVVLFETKDGRTIVADGHQRTGLARRMAEQGQEDVGGMAAVVYREADGYTATEVTDLAALKNIGEGSGTAVDAARVLRNRKDSIADLGLPPNSALVRKAEGLRRLSPDAFGMVVNGVASEELGDVVGRNVTDAGLQPQVLAYLSKNTPANLAQAAMIARDMASNSTTETQDSLFGPEQIQQSLYVERAKVLDGALKSLGTNIRTFRTLIDKAETISTKGNKLDAKQNATQVDDDTKVRQYLTSQANMKGPISDALTKAAEILRSGGTVSRAVQGFIGDTRGALQGTGTGSQTPAPGRSTDEVSAKVEPEAVAPEDAGDDLFVAMLPPTSKPVVVDKTKKSNDKPQDDLLAALTPTPQGKSPAQVKVEAEAKVKAQQSKMRTAAPQSDEGPLFNKQADIEGAPSTSKPVDDTQTENLIDKSAQKLLADAVATRATYTRPGDVMPAGNTDLFGTQQHKALLAKLAAASEFQARTRVVDEWVLAEGEKIGLEILVMMDKSGNVAAISKGRKTGPDAHAVHPPVYAYRMAKAGVIPYSAHNHPRATSPSSNDILLMAAGFGDETVVVTVSGRHSIRKGDIFPDVSLDRDGNAETVLSALREAETAAMPMAQEIFSKTGDDQTRGDAVLRALTNLALDRIGVLRYEGNAAEVLRTEGVDFDGFYAGQRDSLALRLRRAGFDVIEGSDTSGDSTAGGAGIDATGQGPTGQPQGNASDSDGNGGLPNQPVKPDSDSFKEEDAPFADLSDDQLSDLYDVEQPMARDTIAQLLPRMRAELDRLDLGRVKLMLDDTGADWQGMVIGNPFTDMSIIIGASVDPMKTVYHEVIHIFRGMNLFTPQEWTALETMAGREWIAKYEIEERYPDLTREEQIEEAIAEAFADAVATKTAPKGGMIITAFNKIARVMRAFRNVLNGAGFQTAEDVFGKVYAAELTKRAAAPGATGGAMQRKQAETTENDRFAAQIMQELGQVDDLFQNPTATATTIEGVFGEIDPSVTYVGDVAAQANSSFKERAERAGADRMHLLRTANGEAFYIFEAGREVWMDVSALSEGGAGSAIYSAVADYAFNAGQTFIGDPEGLSDVALRRRTDAMLSSALKHGTTKHLAPHARQVDGDKALGVPPLQWRDGEHLDNIAAMIGVSVANVRHFVPEIARARYDFKTGTFRTGKGELITDRALEEWSAVYPRIRAAGAGRRTLKRGILLNTLAHAESGERPGLLERSLQQPGKLVADGLSRTFYQRAKATSFSGPAIDRIKAANAEFAPPQRPEQMPLPPTFPLPNRGKMMLGRELFQDRFIMFEAVNAAIEKASGEKIPEGANFRLRQTVYDGRTSARVEKVLTDEVKPITEAMKRAKIDADDLGTYLLAAHAKERNAVMAQRDPERFGSGNGSGLYDEAADALLAQFAADGKITKLKYLAKMVADMLERDMALRESAGLMSKAEADGYRKMYKNYTPLRGFAERDEGGQTGRLGKGFDIRGKEVRTALGRMSIADNPLVQAIAMRQEGIVRAEKQRANKSLYIQVQKYPNKDLWEIMGKLPTRKILDPDTGMTKNIVDFGAVNEDEVVALKISGQAYYIRIKDPLMAEAIKNMHIAKQSSIELLAKTITIVGKMTRMISRLATGANPNFVFPNAMSDYSEGIWTAYNADKKRMALSYAKNYPLALATAMQGEIRDSSLGRTLSRLPSKLVKRLTGSDIPPEEMGRLERYREEWEMAGGKISFMAFRDLDEITADINAAIKGDGYKRWVMKPWTIPTDMMQVVEKLNQPIESAGRLAMYMTARENGYSQDRAAAMALDSSGNYYRKGRATRGMSAFYAFFNPAVQGIEKFARFAKRPRNIAVLGGVVATGYAMTLLNMLMWEDDDDPEGRPLYLQIPEFERRRSLIIPYGVEIDQSIAEGQPGRQRLKYFMFRVPHNVRFLLTMGNEAAIMQLGYGNASDAASNVTSSMLTSMNPFGSDTVANAAAPTVIDPFVDLALNRSWTGTPIRPDEAMWNEGVPQASQFFERSNSAAAVWTAEKLNQIGGGDRFTPSTVAGGLLDRYPGELDYLFNYWTGGLGRFVNMTGEAILDKAQGVDTDPGGMPIMRSVIGRTNSFPAQERYYSWRETMNADRNQLRAVRKAALENPDDAEAAAEWEYRSKKMNVGTRTVKHKDGTTSEKLVWTDSVVGPIDDADDRLKALREKLTDIQNNMNLSRKDRVTQQRRVKLEIEDVQRIAIRAYLAKRSTFEAAAGSE